MTRADLSRPGRILPFAAAFMLSALPASAQGTDEQREACAPDAVRLCQDTIPDVDRTTACMQRHEAELSPRCRAVFSAAIGGAPAGRRRAGREDDDDTLAARPRRVRPAPSDRDAREAPRDEAPYEAPRRYRDPYGDEDAAVGEVPPPAYVEPGVRQYRYLTPNGEEAQAPDPRSQQPRAPVGRQRAREEIGRLCDEGAMDPETCATTDRALGR